jgi:hypothetical protein
MNLHLHIERIVLEGLPTAIRDAQTLHAAVESRLSQLFLESGITWPPYFSSTLSQLRSRDIRLEAPSDTALVGKQIAEAIRSTISAADLSATPSCQSHETRRDVHHGIITSKMQPARLVNG